MTMAHKIAQFDGQINGSCCDQDGFLLPCCDQDHEAVTMVSGASGPIRARKRRHRRGRNLHKHRLSRHRRARCVKRVMGAPRNNNEYLMSQHNAGLNVQDSQSPHSHVSSGQVELPSPSSSDESTSCSSLSDYSSLHNSPSEDGRYYGDEELIFPDLQLGKTDNLESGCSVLMDGTDAKFLQRNFEEEYTDNITRGLEEATREELISKCLVLMERLKELEDKNPTGAD